MRFQLTADMLEKSYTLVAEMVSHYEEPHDRQGSTKNIFRIPSEPFRPFERRQGGTKNTAPQTNPGARDPILVQQQKF